MQTIDTSTGKAGNGRRGPGRPRNGEGSPVPAPDQPATRKLAELRELRRLHGGVPVPKPAGIDNAVIRPADSSGNAFPRPSQEVELVRAWLEAIVAAGGSPADLDVAWDVWRPFANGVANPKIFLRQLHEQLRAKAGPAHVALRLAAQAEAEPARQLQGHHQRVRLAQEGLAGPREKFEKARADLADAKDALRAFVTQNPWLDDGGAT